MHRWWAWLKATGHWVAQARTWGVGLGVILIVLALFYFTPWPLGDRFRFSGLLLQLLGIFILVLSINEKLRLFNRPSLIGHFFAWLSSRPRYSSASQSIQLQGTTMAITGGRASLSIWNNPADSSVEARMTALEANVRRLKEGQDMAVKQIEEQGTKQEQALTVERTAREHAIQEALTRMEKFGIGGFQVELIGVIWLTVGVILATIPGEISAGLQAVFKQ